MKKTFAVITLVLVIFSFSSASFSSLAALPEGDMPNYNNTSSTFTDVFVENGEIRVLAEYTGFQGITTNASIEVQIKEPGDNGLQYYAGSHQTFYFNAWYGDLDENFPLSDSQIYSIFVIYRIYGSGGSGDVVIYPKTLVVV